VTVFDNRPDPEYIRSLWRGEYPPEGTPLGCGDTSCWCGGGPEERREAGRERKREAYRRRGQPPTGTEDSEDRPPKDPRYTWLPP
jgi:hypothetical protein